MQINGTNTSAFPHWSAQNRKTFSRFRNRAESVQSKRWWGIDCRATRVHLGKTTTDEKAFAVMASGYLHTTQVISSPPAMEEIDRFGPVACIRLIDCRRDRGGIMSVARLFTAKHCHCPREIRLKTVKLKKKKIFESNLSHVSRFGYSKAVSPLRTDWERTQRHNKSCQIDIRRYVHRIRKRLFITPFRT